MEFGCFCGFLGGFGGGELGVDVGFRGFGRGLEWFELLVLRVFPKGMPIIFGRFGSGGRYCGVTYWLPDPANCKGFGACPRLKLSVRTFYISANPLQLPDPPCFVVCWGTAGFSA